jgi:large subunit ribosomal protein L22
MAPVRTNERPGTRAVLRHYHMSASKARVVLDLIRGMDVYSAQEVLASTRREAADVVGKVLASAIANAVNNDAQLVDELYVATAYADEGTTMKRFRPRARGRASRIRKRSCHVTIVVAKMEDERLERARAMRSTEGSSRSRRVAGSRRRADQQSHAHRREVAREEAAEAEAAAAAEEAAAQAGADEEEVDMSAEDVLDTEAVGGATEDDGDDEASEHGVSEHEATEAEGTDAEGAGAHEETED